MQVTNDPQDALDLWNTDDTQWIITDGTQYAVGPEMDALHVLMTSGWEMASPEDIECHLHKALARYLDFMA